MQFSWERRLKAIRHLNLDLKLLIEDEDFSKSGPLLFGAGFKKNAKNGLIEPVKPRLHLLQRRGRALQACQALESFFKGPISMGVGVTTTTVSRTTRRAFCQRMAQKGGQADNECPFCFCKPSTYNKSFDRYSGNCMR